MKIQFDKLFEVEIYHNYYSSGISQDFLIEPTIACQNQLKDYGLIFRQTGKGFAVFYEVAENGGGIHHPLKPIVEDAKFSFLLTSRNPYVINYTNLPLATQSNQMYYLHNLNNNQQNNQLLLTSDATTEFLSEHDLIELRSQFFQYRFESSNIYSEIEVIDELGKTVLQERVAIVEGLFDYPVNLTGYTPGKFIIKIDGIQKLEFYADDTLLSKKIFGVINIFRNDIVPVAYRFTDVNGAVTKKTYSAKLDRRFTFWKYYVVLKYRSNIAAADLSIGRDDPAIVFTRQPVITLSDGTNAVPFVSNNTQPLQQEPIGNIKLVKSNGSSSGMFEIENLENPSVSSITPNPPENKIYSEIFVYV